MSKEKTLRKAEAHSIKKTYGRQAFPLGASNSLEKKNAPTLEALFLMRNQFTDADTATAISTKIVVRWARHLVVSTTSFSKFYACV